MTKHVFKLSPQMVYFWQVRINKKEFHKVLYFSLKNTVESRSMHGQLPIVWDQIIIVPIVFRPIVGF